MSKHDMTTASSLSRRALLPIMGAASAASFVTAGSRAWAACSVTPAQTEGPYWIDERLNRSDIRVDPYDGTISAGVPLTLDLNVLRADASCAPAAASSWTSGIATRPVCTPTNPRTAPSAGSISAAIR